MSFVIEFFYKYKHLIYNHPSAIIKIPTVIKSN
jgi:hypothetical protein